ncbi:MAG TPA: inositol monophosphatase [Tepidisphaeraceae bacterium]|jgi:myo-inositol-1(or 4)-monophosphatase|nr:inositol monophosphatase [Tepidisphaeraceae bacterium]
MSTQSHDLQYIIELARGAGKLIRQRYGKVERLTKTHIAADQEAVTDADRESQRFIVAGLKRRWPDDGIIGEESETGSSITADIPDPLARVWVIDPIDGTNNFIAGLGNFAVCIALLHKGHPILGIVYDVMRDQMYAAAQGEGCWLDNQRLSVLQSPLNDASMLMLTSNLLNSAGHCPQWASQFIAQTNWKVRMLGSAALEATMVAAGVAHASFTVNGKLWDVAAPAALVLEAGGILTDLTGKPLFPYNLRNYQGAKVPFIASTPQAHAPLLDFLRRNP